MRDSSRREEIRSAYRNNTDTSEVLFIPAKEKIDIFGPNHLFKACAYCRVSTDSDEQLSSFELQNQHYRQLADQHPNWDLRHIFADEGISGTSLKKRDEFNEMIDRCFAGEFDLIVTKSVSRFARNLIDCVSLARKLKNHVPPIGIFFETDNLFTLSEDSELKLSILATIAQEESVKKSESMIWSLKERFKSQKLLTPELFGYRRPRDAVGNFIKYAPLEVEESEAEIVRFIYNAFLAGFSVGSICEILSDIGCKTKLGNADWNEGSVLYILRNERYCGNVLTWKRFTADIFEHTKRKNKEDRDQYLYTGVHDPIISVEQFEAVQVLIENRKHGHRGGVPIMQVIDMGIFQGYVPINYHWITENPDEYFQASNSVSFTKKSVKVKKEYFSRFNLTGYQVVRAQYLTAHSELPVISFSKDKISFNCSCTRKFTNESYVQLLLHPVERKIAIRPCSKDDTYSIPWHLNSDKQLSTKTISCPHFCNILYQIMDWFPDYNYRIMGTLIAKGQEQMVIFNLSNAMPNVKYEDKKRISICPEEWGDSFGPEFYNFSMDNALYYSPVNSDLRMSEKSRPVEGQLDFEVLSSADIISIAAQLKHKVADNDEC